MAAQKGRDYVIKYNTTGSTYVAIGGMREPSFTIKNDTVETTSADDAGIRKLLAGGGVTAVTVKGSGVYVNDTVTDTLRAAALASTPVKLQFVVPGTAAKTVASTFIITDWEDSSSYKDAGAYSATFESADVVTIT
ncbi:phage major tail protein, TP901-1 family [Methylorubrum sp. SB2]|uniref:phage major tail protein, TP901-1 family n=1 Tax=Methylorubrum subtropicum TaxID=3138812 RepID=UPI00313B64E0